jgi:hypothetical protein
MVWCKIWKCFCWIFRGAKLLLYIYCFPYLFTHYYSFLAHYHNKCLKKSSAYKYYICFWKGVKIMVAVSQIFDRVKSVALWSANIRKLAKDHKGYGSAANWEDDALGDYYSTSRCIDSSIVIKAKISNWVCAMRFSNNLHQVRSISTDWEATSV